MTAPRVGVRERLRRLRPVPVLWLALVWVLLWGSGTPGDLVNGVLLAALLLVLVPLPHVALGGRPQAVGLLHLVSRFVRDLVVASVQIAWQAVRPGPQAPCSVVAVRLRNDSELLTTLTVEMLALVPGSIPFVVDAPERTLYVHVFGTPDDAAVERFRRKALEQEARIIRALGRPEDRAALAAAEARP